MQCLYTSNIIGVRYLLPNIDYYFREHSNLIPLEVYYYSPEETTLIFYLPSDKQLIL
jgi:hypothetical protein